MLYHWSYWPGSPAPQGGRRRLLVFLVQRVLAVPAAVFLLVELLLRLLLVAERRVIDAVALRALQLDDVCHVASLCFAGKHPLEVVPPQGVVPFTVSQEEAEQALRAWFREHKIERPRVSPIVGAYVPVWTFDISGPLKWSCMVKEGDNWVQRTGEHFTMQDDYLVPASDRLPKSLTDHFDEFDLNALAAYDGRYLADFPAERYQTTVADASLKARGDVMKALRKRPQRYVQTVNYRDFKLSASGGLSVQSYKLILLPLWIAHYKVDDDMYDVTINGQNKVIYGARPKGVVGRLVSWLLG